MFDVWINTLRKEFPKMIANPLKCFAISSDWIPEYLIHIYYTNSITFERDYMNGGRCNDCLDVHIDLSEQWIKTSIRSETELTLNVSVNS